MQKPDYFMNIYQVGDGPIDTSSIYKTAMEAEQDIDENLKHNHKINTLKSHAGYPKWEYLGTFAVYQNKDFPKSVKIERIDAGTFRRMLEEEKAST